MSNSKDLFSRIGWIAAALSLALGLAGLLNLEAIYTPKRVWWGLWVILLGMILFVLSRLAGFLLNRPERNR